MKKIFVFFILFLFYSVLIANENSSRINLFVAVQKDTMIYSMGEGTVIKVGYNSEQGNYIKARYPEYNITITYCNLSKITVQKENVICRGSRLGLVGRTGNIKETGVTIIIETEDNGMIINRNDMDIPSIIHLFDK